VIDCLSFYHRGSLGDIIYSLPTIYSYGKKSILYLRRVGHKEFLYPLIIKQKYIKDVKHRGQLYKGEDYINLSGFVPIAIEKKSQHLVLSHLESLGRNYDFSIPWIDSIDPLHISDIIISRTLRYHDKEEIDWTLLRDFSDKCVFVGHRYEHDYFIKKYKIDINFYMVKDALELAQIIAGSKLFVGNQSCAFSIAEALKVPRCLEVCDYYNNCQPSGNNGYTYLNVDLIKKYLNL
jgi:hypothetical protein